MSKVAELAYDIEQLYIDGMSASQIAQELDCPIGIVRGWIEGNGVADLPQGEFDPFETINS
jgi:transposase